MRALGCSPQNLPVQQGARVTVQVAADDLLEREAELASIADALAAAEDKSLFVTPKAIEYHLANAYRKLGIEGRGGLTGALAEPAGTGGASAA